MKSIATIFFILCSFSAFSKVTILQNGNTQKGINPTYFKVLTWNIQGAKAKGFKEDFYKLLKTTNLGIFQEADFDNTNRKHITPFRNSEYIHATSYQSPFSQKIKGVMTSSTAKNIYKRPLLSQVREAGVATPKATLITKYKLKDHDEVLTIVNVHAINFVGINTYKKHINQIIRAIQNIKGPMIIAGDFNTWSKDRLRYVDKALKNLTLKRVMFGPGRSGLPNMGNIGGYFDQVYYRDLRLRYKQVHRYIHTSDHKPLEVHFSLY